MKKSYVLCLDISILPKQTETISHAPISTKSDHLRRNFIPTREGLLTQVSYGFPSNPLGQEQTGLCSLDVQSAPSTHTASVQASWHFSSSGLQKWESSQSSWIRHSSGKSSLVSTWMMLGLLVAAGLRGANCPGRWPACKRLPP